MLAAAERHEKKVLGGRGRGQQIHVATGVDIGKNHVIPVFSQHFELLVIYPQPAKLPQAPSAKGIGAIYLVPAADAVPHQAPIANAARVVFRLGPRVEIVQVGQAQKVPKLVGHDAHGIGERLPALHGTVLRADPDEAAARGAVLGRKFAAQPEPGDARGLFGDKALWGRGRDDKNIIHVSIVVAGAGHSVGAIVVVAAIIHVGINGLEDLAGEAAIIPLCARVRVGIAAGRVPAGQDLAGEFELPARHLSVEVG